MSNSLHFEMLKYIRQFFQQREFNEIIVPPMVPNPGIETHIHPFRVYSEFEKNKTSFFLHTSPEFYMKQTLAEGHDKIYSLGYCFRDEPSSPIHRNQFIMLEWYRANQKYQSIMGDVFQLYYYCTERFQQKKIKTIHQVKDLRPDHVTIQEIFLQFLNFDILNYLDKEELRIKIEKDHPDVPLPKDKSRLDWEDYYFLLFLNKIEPKLSEYPFLILYEYPAPLAALSKLKIKDPRVCERFEVYINGIEVANCYQELTNYKEQLNRAEIAIKRKHELYGYQLPTPEVLLNSLQKGLPESCGIALGVERMLLSITGTSTPFFQPIL